jgi:hypothetical protein
MNTSGRDSRYEHSRRWQSGQSVALLRVAYNSLFPCTLRDNGDTDSPKFAASRVFAVYAVVESLHTPLHSRILHTRAVSLDCECSYAHYRNVWKRGTFCSVDTSIWFSWLRHFSNPPSLRSLAAVSLMWPCATTALSDGHFCRQAEVAFLSSRCSFADLQCWRWLSLQNAKVTYATSLVLFNFEFQPAFYG